MRKFIFFISVGLLVFLLILLIIPSSAFAQSVVINEFLVDPESSQWVELYNKGSSSVDISGWFIDDNGGSQKYTMPSNTIINAGELMVFESSSFNLNRTSSDIVQLINGTSIEDSYSYTTGPGVDKSYGRQTDGISNWVVFNTPSKASSNNSSTPAPTATPTPTSMPTNSPTPSKTPTPTNTPTPSKTPTPTPTSKPTLTPTTKQASVDTSINFPTTKDSPTSSVSTRSQTATFASALDDSDETDISEKTRVELITATPEKKVLAATTTNYAPYFIGAGIILLAACGILVYRTKQKLYEED